MDLSIRPVEYDHAAITRTVWEIAGEYPFVSVGSVGKSVLGRDIYSISLGSGKKRILFAAAFHGNERITAPLVLKFTLDLAAAASDNVNICGVSARAALNKCRLTVIPQINPDGCEISLHGAPAAGRLADFVYGLCGGDFSKYSANARGVDINHNFNAGWEKLRRLEREAGIYGPSFKQYGGPRPESEPETAALCRLCRENGYGHVLAFHSQGEVIYWNYNGFEIPGAAEKAKLLAEAADYQLDVPVGISSLGGFKDWFIQDFSRPGFTVEVGLGKNPLPADLLPGIYRRVLPLMTTALTI